MLTISTIITYPVLALMSIGKRSFENMGRLLQKSGDTISRLLQPATDNFAVSHGIAQQIFARKNKLFVIIDDTLIKKLFARYMQGAGLFYDTKIGRRIMAFRLMIGMVSDGKYAIPIDCAYLFSTELLELANITKTAKSKNQIAIAFIKLAQRIFSHATITVLADGLYANVEVLSWCCKNGVRAEMRMHSNRVVLYKGQKWKLRDLLNQKDIRPKGRQMARTLSVQWHTLDLELTIVRRIDKNDKESIVFQVATHKALPREHVAHYKSRWAVEKCIRTSKQSLGLEECFSKILSVQHNHVSSVLLAYGLAQLEMYTHKLKHAEAAIRRLKTKSATSLIRYFSRLGRPNNQVDA